jgi:hypothetical protein
MASTARKHQGSEDMRKEFESELAKQISGKRKLSKAWVMVALCAAILVCGAAAVTVASAADQTRDRIQTPDQLKDGTGDNCVGDGICDPILDGDGTCDDCICDGECDCVDCDGDGVCDDCTCDCIDCPCCVVE